MTSQMARKVVQAFRAASSGLDPAVGLTKREEESLSCLAEGYADKEIADKLDITVPTVRPHLSHIGDKPRTEAVIKHLD